MSVKRTYTCIELELRPRDGGLELEARSSIEHQMVRTLVDGPSLEAVGQDVLEALQSRIRAEHENKLRSGREPEPLDQRAKGTSLYRALIAPEIGELLADGLGWTRGLEKNGGSHGIRIRLIFDPGLPDKASLPWEILHRPRLEQFLTRSPDFPLSRSIPGPCPYPLLEVRTPVRVLVVAPSPVDMLNLGLAKERKHIVSALDKHPAIDVETLEHETFDCLVETLEHAGPFHILHYMGHGRFDDERGGLSFEAEDRKEDLIPGKVIGEHLSSYRTIRLVILNSCSSGALTRDRDGDPFAGVATALLWHGVPAVVANQFGISDEAAITFTEKLYESLAHGMPIDAAAAVGRRAIFRADPSSAEWVTPAVFMQVPDGELKISGGVPVRLGIRSIAGWSQGMRKRSKHSLVLLEHFDGRRTKSPETWNQVIAPKLQCFIRNHLRQGHHHVLELPVHSSIAFTLGNLIEAKSGLAISLRQHSVGAVTYWRSDEADPERGQTVTWESLGVEPLVGGSADLAVSIALSQPTREVVERFASGASVTAGSLLHASLPGGPSQQAVCDGAHAWDLAQSMSRAITSWRGEHGSTPTIHILAAAPNAFMFFLGQLSRGFGRVQLYEYLFGETEVGTYFPSIRLPLARLSQDENSTESPAHFPAANNDGEIS